MTVKARNKERVESRPPVSVKGVKDGFLFLLDEQCDFEVMAGYLRELLYGEDADRFSGPELPVSVDYGSRNLTKEQQRELLQLFVGKENLAIREWGPHTRARRSLYESRKGNGPHNLYKGTVRSGQQMFFDGDVVIIGDVNPGGEVVATGDIYVFGKLRGIAHAGARGDHRAVIAAAEFAPMQLRIAGVVTRAPEIEGKVMSTFMECAYLRPDGMVVDKFQYMRNLVRDRSISATFERQGI